ESFENKLFIFDDEKRIFIVTIEQILEHYNDGKICINNEHFFTFDIKKLNYWKEFSNNINLIILKNIYNDNYFIFRISDILHVYDRNQNIFHINGLILNPLWSELNKLNNCL